MRTFDLLSAFARFGRDHRISLRDPSAMAAFFRTVTGPLAAAVENDALLHGQRTENMFEALIVSLGHYKLLKTEDTGTVHPTGQYVAPDFRVVLADDTQWLIEVKNVYDADAERQRFRINPDYLAKLTAYATTMNCELRFALYWARWGLWTLVDPAELATVDGKLAIDMFKAASVNELAKLGDRMIGTRPPLRLRLLVDSSKPRTLDAQGEAVVTLAGAKLFCAENEIVDPVEQSIAWIFIQFGNWTLSEPRPLLTGADVDGIELICAPQERSNPHETFEIVGTLSSLFARYYAMHTLQDGKVIQTEADLVPGWFTPLVAGEPKSTTLPLWTFILQSQRNLNKDSAGPKRICGNESR